MFRQCKICGGAVVPRHTINNTIYYYCSNCDFLQNYYWDDHANSPKQQVAVNEAARADRWPAGKRNDMYEGGWRALELLTSPIAWTSRKAHNILKNIPGYTQLTRSLAKRRLKRVLDFGCGHGVSVLEIRERDGINIIGLDPFSPTTSPHILRESIHEASLEPNSFDAIFSIETMEHIPDVLPTFRALQALLRPGAALLIQTHRLEDPDYIRDQDKWFYLKDPQTHVSIYSNHALEEIAKRTGFRRAETRDIRTARLWK